MLNGVDLSTSIASNLPALKNIEKLERGKETQLPPPEPMLDTLKRYLWRKDALRYRSEIDVISKIGGPSSQYYHACYAIARTMLVPESEKRRCVIVTGVSGSGKTVIAKFLKDIFKAYWKEDT